MFMVSDSLRRAMTCFQFSLWHREVMWEGFIQKGEVSCEERPTEGQMLNAHEKMTQC